MIFECPNCKKSGQVDDSKVPESGVYAICQGCSNRFLIKRDAPKDFEFEPVEQPKPQIPSGREQSRTTSKTQEPEQQIINTEYRRQIYEAAIGKNIDYYLPIFEKFDRDGKTSASWNWAAFFWNLLWCFYRRMNLIGSGVFVLLIFSAVIGKAGEVGVLIDGIFSLITMIGLGMYANAFYYNHINKKTRGLDLTAHNALNQKTFTKMFKLNKLAIYVPISIIAIGIIAAIVIPQLNSEAPAPPPKRDVFDTLAPQYQTTVPTPVPPDDIKWTPITPPPSKTEDKALEDRHYAQIYASHPDALTIVPEVRKWAATLPAKEKAWCDNVLERGTTSEVIELFDAFKRSRIRVVKSITEAKQPHNIVSPAPEAKQPNSYNEFSIKPTVPNRDTYQKPNTINQSENRVYQISTPKKVLSYDDLTPDQKAAIELDCFNEKVKGKYFLDLCIKNKLATQ